MMYPELSVIIPILNEARNLARAVESAWQAGADEVIVVDGGNTDHSCRIAHQLHCQLVTAPPGRGIQLNRGVASGSGELLVFLHADNRLPTQSLRELRSLAQSDRLLWGGFRQHIDAPGRLFRWIERGNLLRAKYRRLVYGDQGLFVSRPLFEQVGGFIEAPLMEDVAISKRLGRRVAPTILDGPITVDPRRWHHRGPLRQTAWNWAIFTLYQCGVPPSKLVKWYAPHSSPHDFDSKQATTIAETLSK